MIVSVGNNSIIAAELDLNGRLKKYGYNCIVDTNTVNYFVKIGDIIKGLYQASGKEAPNIITSPFNSAIIKAHRLLDELEFNSNL